MMGIFEYILDCHPGEPNDSGNNMKQQSTCSALHWYRHVPTQPTARSHSITQHTAHSNTTKAAYSSSSSQTPTQQHPATVASKQHSSETISGRDTISL